MVCSFAAVCFRWKGWETSESRLTSIRVKPLWLSGYFSTQAESMPSTKSEAKTELVSQLETPLYPVLYSNMSTYIHRIKLQNFEVFLFFVYLLSRCDYGLHGVGAPKRYHHPIRRHLHNVEWPQYQYYRHTRSRRFHNWGKLDLTEKTKYFLLKPCLFFHRLKDLFEY